MKPEISIIIPVYNAEKTLARCLDSVLNQSFRNFEVILIDDGSSDSSGRICDRYCAADPRIRVIHQENAGASAARNSGIDLAEGKYLAFLDSDDWVMPAHLEQYYTAIEQLDCDVVIGGYHLIEQNGSDTRIPERSGKFSGEIWEDICTDPSIYGYLWNKLFRRELICRKNIRLSERMYSQEDLDFCLSAFGQADSVGFIPSTSYQYYYMPGKRVPPFWDYIANQLKMLRIGKSRTDLSAHAQGCVHKRILSLLYTGLYQAAESGNFPETVERISQVDGLLPVLRTVPASGEHGFVARNFAAGGYRRIQRYFWIRNRIRDVVRVIRGRKP